MKKIFCFSFLILSMSSAWSYTDFCGKAARVVKHDKNEAIKKGKRFSKQANQAFENIVKDEGDGLRGQFSRIASVLSNHLGSDGKYDQELNDLIHSINKKRSKDPLKPNNEKNVTRLLRGQNKLILKAHKEYDEDNHKTRVTSMNAIRDINRKAFDTMDCALANRSFIAACLYKLDKKNKVFKKDDISEQDIMSSFLLMNMGTDKYAFWDDFTEEHDAIKFQRRFVDALWNECKNQDLLPGTTVKKSTAQKSSRKKSKSPSSSSHSSVSKKSDSASSSSHSESEDQPKQGKSKIAQGKEKSEQQMSVQKSTFKKQPKAPSSPSHSSVSKKSDSSSSSSSRSESSVKPPKGKNQGYKE